MTDAPSPILADSLGDLPGLRHGFFTREGGVSVRRLCRPQLRPRLR